MVQVKYARGLFNLSIDLSVLLHVLLTVRLMLMNAVGRG